MKKLVLIDVPPHMPLDALKIIYRIFGCEIIFAQDRKILLATHEAPNAQN